MPLFSSKVAFVHRKRIELDAKPRRNQIDGKIAENALTSSAKRVRERERGKNKRVCSLLLTDNGRLMAMKKKSGV